MKTLAELMDLSDRVAVVTGGAGKIGMAFSQALLELGAKVVIVDRDESAIEVGIAHLRARPDVQVEPVVADLTSHDEVKSIPRLVEAQFGRLDILVNNAAYVGTTELEGWATSFEQQSVTTFAAALDINLTAAFSLTQASCGLLTRHGVGSVINIGSTYGMVGPDSRLYENTDMGNPAAYAASKGGIIQLTRWLSTTLAPKVRVNSISPGGVWRGQPEVFHEKYVARTPLQRMAAEEDFKGAVAYLASDLSNYVTGHNLMVDGGWTAW